MKRKYFNIKRFLNAEEDKYGLRATREAFGIQKSTIYDWKKKLRESGNNPFWYNTIKPHSALKKSASLEFILNQYIKNKQKVQNAMELYNWK